jgi:multisubunit Na+/H+ antiporter MnhE subunit
MSRGVRCDIAKFFIVSEVGLLFIALFIALLAALAPIAFRIGKLFVEPILWLYESNNFSVGLSLVGSITPAIVAIALAGLLRRRGRRAVPTMMVNAWFWFFVIIYVVFFSMVLPLMSPTAAAVLLSLNLAALILAAPLIIIAVLN